MRITSPAFEHNTRIPSKYTCDGANINPPLEFADVPKNAVSLVLIVDDPDAPAGTWVHWTLWNMQPGRIEILEDNDPVEATEGVTSFGNTGYGGPCPPANEHRYFFKLYALDCELDLDEKSEIEYLEKVMEGRVIEKCELIGVYERV
jgi:hypothetical protein